MSLFQNSNFFYKFWEGTAKIFENWFAKYTGTVKVKNLMLENDVLNTWNYENKQMRNFKCVYGTDMIEAKFAHTLKNKTWNKNGYIKKKKSSFHAWCNINDGW